MSGELLAVRLLVPYGDKSPGELVLVDRQRAQVMEQNEAGSIEPPATEVRCEGNGYLDELAGSYTAAPAGPPSHKMVEKAPKRKGGA